MDKIRLPIDLMIKIIVILLVLPIVFSFDYIEEFDNVDIYPPAVHYGSLDIDCELGVFVNISGEYNPYFCAPDSINAGNSSINVNKSYDTGDGSAFALMPYLGGDTGRVNFYAWRVSSDRNNVFGTITDETVLSFDCSAYGLTAFTSSYFLFEYDDDIGDTKFYLDGEDIGVVAGDCQVRRIIDEITQDGCYNATQDFERFEFSIADLESDGCNMLGRNLKNFTFVIHREGGAPIYYFKLDNVSLTNLIDNELPKGQIKLEEEWLCINETIQDTETTFYLNVTDFENDNIYFDYDCDYDEFEEDLSGYIEEYFTEDDYILWENGWFNGSCEYTNYDYGGVVGSALRFNSTTCLSNIQKFLGEEPLQNDFDINFLMNVYANDILQVTLADEDDNIVTRIKLENNETSHKDGIYNWNETDWNLLKEYIPRSFGYFFNIKYDLSEQEFLLYISSDFHDSFELLDTFDFVTVTDNINTIDIQPNGYTYQPQWIDTIYIENVIPTFNFVLWTNQSITCEYSTIDNINIRVWLSDEVNKPNAYNILDEYLHIVQKDVCEPTDYEEESEDLRNKVETICGSFNNIYGDNSLNFDWCNLLIIFWAVISVIGTIVITTITFYLMPQIAFGMTLTVFSVFMILGNTWLIEFTNNLKVVVVIILIVGIVSIIISAMRGQQ